MALASYNGRMGNVMKWLRTVGTAMMESIFREYLLRNSDYLEKVEDAYKQYKKLCNLIWKKCPMIRKILYSLVIFFLIFATMGCSISKILPIQQDETQEDTREETGLLPELTLPTMGGQLRIPISQPDSIDPLLTKSRDFINFSGLIVKAYFPMIRTLT